ncbi:hypothetical protein, partial [Treponema sp.]|uniref:hypothetical protein n=1 Tax=Treponema sp. TaxID=166 RepID=UPI003EFE4087
MTNNRITILFFIGVFIFTAVALSFFILNEINSYKVYFLLLFLSTCCMLPKSINDVKPNKKKTPIDWKLLIGNIIGSIFTLISFIICLV